MSSILPKLPFEVGTKVRIKNSAFKQAVIVEVRGELGPKGARVYRLMVRPKPRPAFIEVLESQIELAD